MSERRGRLDRALYELKTIGARYPRLVVPAARWRGRGVPLSPDTDILIEGFPRSANTFTVAAFSMAQPRPVRIAHHLHAPGHAIAALKRGLPALILVREPEDAVLEYTIRRPAITIAQAVRGYIRFYGPLIPYRNRFVTGSFDQVTTDLGTVIRGVNRRFGTAFREFEHTEENVRKVFQAIEIDYSGMYETGDALEIAVARPSALREEIKAGLRRRYRDEVPSRQRVQAIRLFDALREATGPRDRAPR